MRTIAISAPYHFSNQKTLFESLDSVIKSDEKIKLITPAIGSLSNLIREYADNNGFEYEFYLADWSKEVNADLERDKRIISDADEIILFDDGCTNKINLLKQWAEEKNIHIFDISITPNDSVKYAEILAKELSHITNNNEIIAAIEEFEIAKEQAIKEAQYELAAILRDKLRILSMRTF